MGRIQLGCSRFHLSFDVQNRIHSHSPQGNSRIRRMKCLAAAKKKRFYHLERTDNLQKNNQSLESVDQRYLHTEGYFVCHESSQRLFRNQLFWKPTVFFVYFCDTCNGMLLNHAYPNSRHSNSIEIMASGF